MNLTQAILPVAGLGTRFLPWTKVVPKELLPIGNQPIIALLVDECIQAGITDICFVISKGKEAIAEYFWEHPALEHELERRGKTHYLEELQRYDNVNFHVVYQDEQHGDGHAILQAQGWVHSDHIAILFGDDLFHGEKTGLQQLKSAYEHLDDTDGPMIALENIDREFTYKYGIIDVDSEHADNNRLKNVKGLVEKPNPSEAPSTYGIVGRYIIPRSTFEVLPLLSGNHTEEIRLIDAFSVQLGTCGVHAYECEGTRIDTGTPEGYREAIRLLG